MNWKCEEHNQNEYTCIKTSDGYFLHYQHADALNDLKTNNMNKQTLQEIFNEIGNLTLEDRGGNDKGGKIHTYLETYDRLFAPFMDNSSIMEIGLATGDSIKLWDRYFRDSVIVGVDLSIIFKPSDRSNNGNFIYLIASDATQPKLLNDLEETFNNETKFNIIIDDGDHQTNSQIETFNLLKSKMKKGGLYIIEDLLALDIERERYLALHDNVEIVDMRSNGRFDNALCIIRF